jgi:hypothetical protein
MTPPESVHVGENAGEALRRLLDMSPALPL